MTPLEKLNFTRATAEDNNPTEMASPKSSDEQLADLKRFNDALRSQLKKVNEELTATRNNQRTLIDLLADTMKRLKEAEAALEEEKKPAVLPLLQRAARCTSWADAAPLPRDPWRVDLWDRGVRTYEALLAQPRPTETAGVCGGTSEAPSTQNPPQQPPTDAEDLYA